MYRRDDLLLFNELLQDPEFPGLQETDTPLWKEPHACFFVRIVKNFNLIICHGVINRAAAILLEELEKHVTPGATGRSCRIRQRRFSDKPKCSTLVVAQSRRRRNMRVSKKLSSAPWNSAICGSKSHRATIALARSSFTARSSSGLPSKSIELLPDARQTRRWRGLNRHRE